MKKVIILIGLLVSNMAFAEADTIVKTPVQDFTVAEGWDYIYDITTPAFEKVQLDCQSMVSGMQFYQNETLVNKVYIDNYECAEVSNFFIESKEAGLPICLELNTKSNLLIISRETDECH